MVEPDREHKYCPECGAEYDAQYHICTDCLKELVDARTLAEIRKGQKGKKDSPEVPVVYFSYEQADAELARDTLLAAGIEAVLEEVDLNSLGLSFTKEKGYQVIVPASEKDKSIFHLQQAGLIPSAACAGAAHADAEVIDRFKKTIEQGVSALPELVQFLYEELPVRRQAIYAILSAGEEGEELLAQKVVEICQNPNPLEERELEIVKDIGAIVGERGETCALVDEIADALADPDATVRRNLVTALGYADMDEALPGLVICLEDSDPDVRHEAIDALFFRTGEDFGFQPDAPEEEREEALKKWRRWLNKV
jgi:hypothetical protein